ncbi:hypothetical protein MMC19_005664 [Ptychographa xylographoides]|nr:hypothetical protein [Ptychographa xylographoides]
MKGYNVGGTDLNCSEPDFVSGQPDHVGPESSLCSEIGSRTTSLEGYEIPANLVKGLPEGYKIPPLPTNKPEYTPQESTVLLVPVEHNCPNCMHSFSIWRAKRLTKHLEDVKHKAATAVGEFESADSYASGWSSAGSSMGREGGMPVSVNWDEFRSIDAQVQKILKESTSPEERREKWARVEVEGHEAGRDGIAGKIDDTIMTDYEAWWEEGKMEFVTVADNAIHVR